MCKVRVIIIAVTLWAAGAARAADIDYDALRQEGYGDMAELVKSMTPEQQAELMKQAALKEKELQAMPPEKVNTLNAQMHAVNDTLYVNKVDPAKLDVSKAKSMRLTMKNISVYQKNYAEGKIKNGVVKPVQSTRAQDGQ